MATTVLIDNTNTYAASAAMRELVNRMYNRTGREQAGYTFELGTATAEAIVNAPLCTVKDGDDVVAVFTIVGIPTVRKDIMGLPQQVYTPHVLKVAFAETIDKGLLYGALLGEIYNLGTSVEVYEAETDKDEGDAETGIPVETDLIATETHLPVASWVNNVYWPVSGSL